LFDTNPAGIADASTVAVSGWGREGERWLRPQSVAFTLLAEQVAPHDVALFSGSFIDAFARVGISEHATRQTLSRMVQRGLLERHRRGRRAYFSMTERCRAVLEDGRQRIWDVGAVTEDTDADWTMLTFSLPESWQRERHGLRTRLTWAGFGSLHSGVWIAPSTPHAVGPLVEELGVDAHVHVFQVRSAPVTDLAKIAREAFDLDALAAGYEAFLADWAACPDDRPAEDPLALTLRLSTEWLQVLSDDPRVPLDLLPVDWPAVRAQERFRALHTANCAAAAEVAAERFDMLEPPVTS
jgi:phenylacetic acid degradation operon negative regulatory protein